MAGDTKGRQSKRRILVASALIVFVFLSGCATITVSSSVTADGTIEEYRMQINTSSTVYGYLNEAAKEDGYESLQDQFLSDFNESRAEDIEYNEEFQGDDVTITLTITEFEPPSDSSLSITREDGTLVYEDQTFVNETAAAEEESDMSESVTSGLVVRYQLTMPGEITDSNADEVDGNTAEWRETGMDGLVDNGIYAESEVPSGIGLDGPGFGAGTAIMALLAVAVLGYRMT